MRFALLTECATAALESGRLAEALRYADAAIAMAPGCRDYFHRLDDLHQAHIVRGRVALAKGDVIEACAELAAAGAQGSSEAPMLRSHGPDFRLARLLFERDEVGAVLAYLDRCATFWKPTLVASWRDAIARGERIRLYRE